ncbi:Hypothetical predicted protein [Paramuricea clavata]|uniref:Uncharacterized protein n=1 Tax=Paramuricea clavata TaxID=317549 RepID=A0A7D9MG51_PARCT|nr:Hypothetical predicted protein [Paramuricea clavata]
MEKVPFQVLTAENGTGLYLERQHMIKCTADIQQRMEHMLPFFRVSFSCQVKLIVIY